MLLDAVAPLDGVEVQSLLAKLKEIKNSLQSVHNGDATSQLSQYQDWSIGAAESLGFFVSNEDVESLILTRRHWTLLDIDLSNPRLVNSLISAEWTDRQRALDRHIKAYERIEQTWSGCYPAVVVPDTNVYIHHELRFDDIDWCALVGEHPDVRLWIPMQVIRELDKQKRVGRSTPTVKDGKEMVSTRARETSKRFRELFTGGQDVVELQSGVHAELLLDPVGHMPLPDGDTEIIDRALTGQALIGRPVSIATGDGNMQFGAKVAGLEVIEVET